MSLTVHPFSSDDVQQVLCKCGGTDEHTRLFDIPRIAVDVMIRRGGFSSSLLSQLGPMIPSSRKVQFTPAERISGRGTASLLDPPRPKVESLLRMTDEMRDDAGGS